MTSATGSTTVDHENGLHARPASVFVQTASKFDADVTVRNPDGDEANAKSSIAVMSLGVETGERIELSAEGPDSQAAVDSLIDLVERDFETD